MTISDEMVEIAAQALFDRECTRAKMRGQIMHHPAGQRVASMVASYRDDYFADAREMLTAALQGSVVVPEEALLWLNGEGPDADGKWFGETIEDGIPKLAGKYPRTYWWRSKFRSMVTNWPSVPRHELGSPTAEHPPHSRSGGGT